MRFEHSRAGASPFLRRLTSRRDGHGTSVVSAVVLLTEGRHLSRINGIHGRVGGMNIGNRWEISGMNIGMNHYVIISNDEMISHDTLW